MKKPKKLTAASRPFKAREYGKCPIEDGIRGEHHTINPGDIIVRLERGIRWYEKRLGHDHGSKVFEVECSTMYAHEKCLIILREKEEGDNDG